MANPVLGPFDVAGEDIERVRDAFTVFVSGLLEVEGRRAGLLGHQLRLDRQDETADGGVDAVTDVESATLWLPAGRTAWQFKRSDVGPSKCKKELTGAEWARELLGQGAGYRLVLGAQLTARKVESRRQALVDQAVALGLTTIDADAIQVLDANALARWVSEFPSLAASRLFLGRATGIEDFGQWGSSRHHQHGWVTGPERDQLLATLRGLLLDKTGDSVRVEGVSGVGKTRLVMEAMRTDELQSLVAYVPDERSVGAELLAHLLEPRRTTVLVVDECPGRSHDKLSERLTVDSTLRLITIGDADGYPLRSPTIAVPGLPATSVEEILAENYGQLPIEVRRVVVEQCDGNPRFAVILAERLKREPDIRSAADLIKREDVAQFIERMMPEGRAFFLTTVLATLERVGWDGALRRQLEQLALFAGASVSEFEALALDLESLGLLSRQGRYRAITPHPLAVLLAAAMWRSQGRRIVDEFVPAADREMLLSLLRRVADLGSYEPASAVLQQLMNEDGPFGSLHSIDEHNLGEFLTQLAIVAPVETATHLANLLLRESLETLRAMTNSRRDLVWTLEKLAWHSTTFEVAADLLLRLALAENETYANNATGTWLALFKASLPATAAAPSDRTAYLGARARSDDADTRSLVVTACESAMSHHESVMVSAEDQGGRFVEPRGSVRTYQEAAEYRVALIQLLEHLALDSETAVADKAAEALGDAIHAWLDDPVVGPRLVAALLHLSSDQLAGVRRKVERLRQLYRRAGARDDREALIGALDRLAEDMPPAERLEELTTLLDLSPWDFEEGEELLDRLKAIVRGEVQSQGLATIAPLLESRQLPSGWFLGRTLAEILGPSSDVENVLAQSVQLNLAAVSGYLQGLVDSGLPDAFDGFLATHDYIDDLERLLLTVRGPMSEAARSRAFTLLESRTVAEGAQAMFGWLRQIDAVDVERLVAGWISRVATQEDYNALVDWLSLWLHDSKDVPDAIREPVFALLLERRNFPAIANEAWDWSRIMRRYADDFAPEVAGAVLDLVNDSGLTLHPSGSEAELLCTAASRAPAEVWADVTSRIGARDWRVAINLRGWFSACVSLGVVADWVGSSSTRARIAASIAAAGAEKPTALARLLLENFGQDDDVRSELAAEYMSGVWVGPESGRLRNQIDELEAWKSPDEHPSVCKFASELQARLRERLAGALQREAERGF